MAAAKKTLKRTPSRDFQGRGKKKFWILAFIFFVTFILWDLSPAFSQMKVLVPDLDVNVSFRKIEENKVMATVSDEAGKPVKGLGKEDFKIKKDQRPAEILSVEPLLVRKDIGLNIVMVIDNSFSMKERDAIKPLREALDKFLAQLRPIDNAHLIVYDQEETTEFGRLNLHLKKLSSNDVQEMKYFLSKSFDENLSGKTYLYDGIYAGIQTIKNMPAGSNPFLVIFSDGEEINSVVEKPEIESAAGGVDFSAYAVDYMPKPEPDPFLKSFAERHHGRLWKAGEATELLPIFEAVSTAMFQHYIITYRFLAAPAGTISLLPSTLRIEEVTTIDSSPLLNRVFFDTGSSIIPDRYILFSTPAKTKTFVEGDLKGTMEKYHHVLNVIGKRMAENPGASVTLTGCNSGYGKEKQAVSLSRNRADSVADYLQYIWGINRGRIHEKARNLPMAPSTSRVPEGRAENQRVEIESDNPEIMDTVKSTYVQKRTNTQTIRIYPEIEAEAGIEKWNIFLRGDDGTMIKQITGMGKFKPHYDINIERKDLERLSTVDRIIGGFEVVDNEGKVLRKKAAASADVEFIKKKELIAQEKGYRVIEKFALILFEFDKAKIKGRNQRILDRIVTRIRKLPEPRIKIEGHTDNIGTEEYNQNLSTRRAKAVYDALTAAGAQGFDIIYYGVGEKDPLYTNDLPEGRQLNRTVSIELEYMKRQ